MFDFGNANEKQIEAITTTKGPVLITAGPGTGKTSTLTYRTLYLIEECKVNAESILIATFTDKAARELITRITKEASERDIKFNINDMYIGTFHSICLRIIKENLEYTRFRHNYRLLDEFEQKYIVFQNMEKFRAIEGINKVFPYKNENKAREIENKWGVAKQICGYTSKLTEELVRAEDLMADEDEGISAIGKILACYQDILKKDNMIDFAGIQTECYRLLTENPEVLDKMREKIQYLMIDEYQDTNYIQEQLVFLFGKKDEKDEKYTKDTNICVVGDDDQSLYRFRGATVRNILEFQKKFHEGECRKISLEKNYRSNAAIIDFYNKWMETTKSTEEGQEFAFSWERGRDKFRHEKKIVPDEKKKNDYKAVMKLSGETEDEWHQKVVEFLKNLKKLGKITDYNQIVFLFERVRKSAAGKLADALEASEIQVYSPRSRMFFKREEIMLAIGCLLIMFSEYKGYRGKNTVFYRYYRNCIKKVKALDDAALKEFIEKINPAGYSYSALLYMLFQFKTFGDLLNIELTACVVDVRPARNLAVLTNIIATYEYLHDVEKAGSGDTERLFDEYLKLLYQVGINEYEDEAEYAPSGCVSFMTIHQAKGMEFPVVFVDSLGRGPKKKTEEAEKADDDKEQEEKINWIRKIEEAGYYRRPPYEPYDQIKYFDIWRKYYTAFSRAQDLLVLTCYEKKSNGEKNAPGGYFKKLYNSLPDEFDNNINFADTKKTDLKDIFSFTSHIAVYDGCPLQYKFYKELGFKSVKHGNTAATAFGTLVHETIEDIHREILRKRKEKEKITKEDITEKNIVGWLNSNYSSLLQSDKNVYLSKEELEDALKHVLRYVARMEGKWDTIQQAEVDVILAEKDKPYIIEGKIDLVKGENDTVEIVDFKTSDNKPAKGSDSYKKYKKQLQLYAHLVEEKQGQRVSRMHLHYTVEEGDPLITFEYMDEDVQKTIDEFDATARKIMAKDFPKPETFSRRCEKCDFRLYCWK